MESSQLVGHSSRTATEAVYPVLESGATAMDTIF